MTPTTATASPHPDASREPAGDTAVPATEKLGPFGHHPEVDFDFCIEIDVLTGYAYDVRVGANFSNDWRATSQWTFWGRMGRALRFVHERSDTLDAQSHDAIPLLLSLEGYALRQDDMPLTALPALARATPSPGPSGADCAAAGGGA